MESNDQYPVPVSDRGSNAPNTRSEDYVCGMNVHWARSQVRNLGAGALRNYLEIAGYDHQATDNIMRAARSEGSVVLLAETKSHLQKIL